MALPSNADHRPSDRGSCSRPAHASAAGDHRPGWCDAGTGPPRTPTPADGASPTHRRVADPGLPVVRAAPDEAGFPLQPRQRLPYGFLAGLRRPPGGPTDHPTHTPPTPTSAPRTSGQTPAPDEGGPAAGRRSVSTPFPVPDRPAPPAGPRPTPHPTDRAHRPRCPTHDPAARPAPSSSPPTPTRPGTGSRTLSPPAASTTTARHLKRRDPPDRSTCSTLVHMCEPRMSSDQGVAGVGTCRPSGANGRATRRTYW